MISQSYYHCDKDPYHTADTFFFGCFVRTETVRVSGDARSTTLLVDASKLAVVLADAHPATLIVHDSLVVVLADARPDALLALSFKFRGCTSDEHCAVPFFTQRGMLCVCVSE